MAIIEDTYTRDTNLTWANHGSMTHCYCCGRKINGDTRYWVEVVRWGGFLASIDHGDDPSSLGFFPVGPECRKRIPENYVHDELKGLT